jgi:protein phosphatase
MLQALIGRLSFETDSVELRLTSGGWTAQGRLREVNQDQWVANPVGGVFIVADGIGGGVCGDIASRTAAECLSHELLLSDEDTEHTSDLIHAAFAAAQEKILQTAVSRDCQCMGTTAIDAIYQDARSFGASHRQTDDMTMVLMRARSHV